MTFLPGRALPPPIYVIKFPSQSRNRLFRSPSINIGALRTEIGDRGAAGIRNNAGDAVSLSLSTGSWRRGRRTTQGRNPPSSALRLSAGRSLPALASSRVQYAYRSWRKERTTLLPLLIRHVFPFFLGTISEARTVALGSEEDFEKLMARPARSYLETRSIIRKNKSRVFYAHLSGRSFLPSGRPVTSRVRALETPDRARFPKKR